MVPFYSIIAKANSLESRQEKLPLVEDWVNGLETETLSTVDFLKIAEFVDGLLEEFSLWPSLLDDGAHSFYIKKQTVVKVLNIAKLLDDAADLSFSLGEELKNNHFLVLAFKWYSLSAFLGNDAAEEKVTELYLSNRGIINHIPFRLCKVLLFKLCHYYEVFWILSSLEGLIDYSLENEKLSEEKKNTLRREKNEISSYSALFTIQMEEDAVEEEVIPIKEFPHFAEINYLDTYFRLKKDLSFNARCIHVYVAMVNLLSLAFAFRGCLKVTFDKELKSLFEREVRTKGYFLKFKRCLEATFQTDKLFKTQEADRWPWERIDKEEAQKAAVYLLEHLDELNEVSIRQSFEFCSELEKDLFLDAFLKEFLEKNYSLKSRKKYDSKLLMFLINQCAKYKEENNFSAYFVYTEEFTAEEYDRFRKIEREKAEDYYGTCLTVEDLKLLIPDEFGIFLKSCVVWFCKNKKIQELTTIITKFADYSDFISWLFASTEFNWNLATKWPCEQAEK